MLLPSLPCLSISFNGGLKSTGISDHTVTGIAGTGKLRYNSIQSGNPADGAGRQFFVQLSAGRSRNS